jgi:4-diphosphocytidyl-2-C-methyl-D-erythritol kinase
MVGGLWSFIQYVYSHAMLAFPNAKINLGLHILNKRSDGYHDIETVFYPVKWCDVLEIIPAEKKVREKVQFKTTGIKITGKKESNLCVKAYRLLQQKYQLPEIQMHLHKLVPIGAGLGGGSSDASQVLLLLDNMFNLRLTKDELQEAANTLGSDCGFFIHNKPLLAKGKGDVFEEITISLKDYFFVIVMPDIHISTADAYRHVTAELKKISLKEIISMPIEKWKDLLVNDFEKTALKKYPVIEYLKQEMYKLGATYASMSGSGSAVYGIFKKEVDVSNQFKEYSVKAGWLE